LCRRAQHYRCPDRAQPWQIAYAQCSMLNRLWNETWAALIGCYELREVPAFPATTYLSRFTLLISSLAPPLRLPPSLPLQDRLAKQVLHLAVDASQFVLSPGFQGRPELRTDSKQVSFSWPHSSGVKRSRVHYRVHFRFAAEHHHQVANHRGSPLVIQLHDPLLRELLQSHVDHTHRSMDDLLPGRAHRFALLPPHHCLRNLRSIRQVRQPGFLDGHARLGQSLLQFGPQRLRNFIHSAAQRDFIVLTVIVAVTARHVAQRRFALGLDVSLVIIDIKR